MSQVAILVEVGVATARPPRLDARIWTWVLVDEGPFPSSAAVEAEQTAILMASCDPRVVMAVYATIIDWQEQPAGQHAQGGNA